MTLLLGACRKPADGDARNEVPAVTAPELMTNQLGSLPGAVYQNQARSPIRWQAWSRETLDRAKAARKLVLCVVAIPQHPGFGEVLDTLASDVELVRTINDFYVPVLVDGDAAREMSLVTADLCAEINRPVELPLFLWMTHEANPVAWLPMSARQPSSLFSTFLQSHTMVSQMWQDSTEYVIKNSRLDNENRRARIEQRKNIKVMSEEPAVDLLRALRQLNSLYDPLTRNFDETGGLFPTSSLELLAVSSVHPGLPADLRERSASTTRELMKDLLTSAMFDPLDGGVFSARRGPSWVLPNFVKDCVTQSRVAVALLEVYRASGDTLARDRALELLAYSENHHATPEGLFSIGFTKPTPPELWMWSVEDIRELLPSEDADWWIKATGMKGLGNLPSELDPRREFFRANTLSLAQRPAEIAAEHGIDPAAFETRFKAARDKLLAARNKRLGRIPRDQSPHAAASFRMVSAYAAAFCATGDDSYRQKAVELLGRARVAFSEGPRLRAFASEAPVPVGAGRNFLYALAMQAALDVAAITSEESWLVWSEDLATTAAELFTGEQLLKECPDDSNLMNLPITDLVMLFDDSTAGLISMAECRLAESERPLLKSFSELATPFPSYTTDRPVLHTDLIIAAISRHYGVIAIYGADLSPDLKLAIERLPMRMVQRRAARADEQVPAGHVKLRFIKDDRTITVDSAAAMLAAIRPAASDNSTGVSGIPISEP